MCVIMYISSRLIVFTYSPESYGFTKTAFMEEQLVILKTKYGDIYLSGEVPFDEDEILVGSENEAPPKVIEKELSRAMSGVYALFDGLQEVREKLAPDEFSVEVGAKMDVKTGVFVVSAGSEVNFKIQLKWTPNKK